MCLCRVMLLITSLRIADASPATFETPLDARREDDNPDAEEQSGKKTDEEAKGGPPTTHDDKSSQDFNKRKEALGTFLTGKIVLQAMRFWDVLSSSLVGR